MNFVKKKRIGRDLLVLALSLASSIAVGAGGKQKARKAIDHKAIEDLVAPAQKEVVEKKGSLDRRFEQARKKYREGDLNDQEMWAELSELSFRGKELSAAVRSQVLQAQAHLLMRQDYQIAAAVFASQALRVAENPFAKEFERAWIILKEVSGEHMLHNLLEVLAQDLSRFEGEPKEFGSDWHYFRGNNFARMGKPDRAILSYAKVKSSQRYFAPARYQTAMILLEMGKGDDAIKVLMPLARGVSSDELKSAQEKELTDLSRLALARIYYEQKKFQQSIGFYRTVRPASPFYYDTLFEQSWAFFMAGYPTHALGSLHAAESPFYKQVFNPETEMLRSLIYYWMCRYDDSRNSLADFIQKYGDDVDALGRFVDQRGISDETGYTMFENLIIGVSEGSLGISKRVLLTAASKPPLMLSRDQYASLLEERKKIEKKGIFGSEAHTAVSLGHIDRWAAAMRQDIGRKFISELRSMKSDYERLYSQAQFLYLELLMSEKDQILGKELHAETKIDRLVSKDAVKGWTSKKTQTWGESDKDEFWWDEMGFYIYRVQPMCAVGH